MVLLYVFTMIACATFDIDAAAKEMWDSLAEGLAKKSNI